MGKKLWVGIVVYYDHDNNRLEWKIGASIVKKSQIFDFFEISYTFTLNFPYKMWPAGGGGQMTSKYSQIFAERPTNLWVGQAQHLFIAYEICIRKAFTAKRNFLRELANLCLLYRPER